MGIYVSKYIEYRTKDGKWHLLESFIPKTDENSEYNENTPTVETQDSRLLYRNSEHVERLGHWNAFLYSGRNESPFEGRGLPEDMSEELRQIMDGVKENSYAYGYSWFSLQELWDKYEADLEQFKREFTTIYYESMLSATNTKLDRIQQSIIALKNGDEIPSGGDEKMDETELWTRLNDFFEFNYEELVNEFAFHQEVSHLLSDMQSYFYDKNIRVVYYMS